MDPWYRVATPRKEVREGRSFNPDEVANILFPLADCEHPLPPPPSGAAALRSPVDRRGTHLQQVGGGAASVPAGLQGRVGTTFARSGLRWR